jgi:riboflavin kinase
MSESTAAVASNDEIATLRLLASEGGLVGPAKVSCAGVADRLDTSNQTASRRLQRLEEADLIERDVVGDGQWVSVTDEGESLLRRQYEQYRGIFEGERTVALTGVVTSGMGEGSHYIELPGYAVQFEGRLEYEPFPGTLNVDLDEESVRARAGMASLEPVPIDGWEDDDRTFGPAECYPVRIVAGEDSYEGAHIIVPERTHHDEDQLEIIAPDKLRAKLRLEDGDRVTVHVGEIGEEGDDE